MDFNSFSSEARKFSPALALQKIFSIRAKRVLEYVFLLALLFSVIFYFLTLSENFFGFVLLIFGVTLILLSIETFFNYFYFKGLDSSNKPELSFELAEVILKTKKDVTKGFFTSSLGKALLLRCLISKKDFGNFLKKRKKAISASDLSFKEKDFTAYNYVEELFEKDKELSAFFFKRGIQEKDFLKIIGWLEKTIAERKRKERWWSKENLLKIQGIGKSWSYGETYELKKFSSPLSVEGTDWKHLTLSYRKLINLLETTLSRSNEANVALVGEDDSGLINVVSSLAKKVKEGKSREELNYHEFLVLDHNYVVAQGGNKTGFEKEMIKILNQSANAGNIILILEDFPSFLESAKSLGSDLAGILDPYLLSSDLKVLILSDRESFHKAIETNTNLSSKFEIVIAKEDDLGELEEFLLSFALSIESKNKVYFSYQSIRKTAESAEKYFTGKDMRDKAQDILIEVASVLKGRKVRFITEEDINSLVESKTGISVGEVKEEERFKLENLEAILHKRVIGQDEAVKAISSTIRRVRSGITDPKKPLGSFLFLGPTGVGKTETAKTLAETFFGSEQKMIRLDMSEYNSYDSVNKLLGSFDTGKVGVLVTEARDNPYTVLLLDEFEKAHTEILDLFLQILDEGIFSDMYGKKVSLRSAVIIATSNAGSSDIWEIIRRGENLMEKKDEIVRNIIGKNIFKPELINRFDGVILFHPLERVHLQKITQKLLQRLRNRLMEKGIDLVINDDIVEFLVEKGTDPKFGARPLERAIETEIEDKIAKKIISKEVKPGSSVELRREDLI